MAPRGILFDNDKVREAISTSITWSEALRKLGITPQADNFRRIREAAERSGSSLKPKPVKEKRKNNKHYKISSLDQEEFKELIDSSSNMNQLCKKIGVGSSSGNYQRITNEMFIRDIPFPSYAIDKYCDKSKSLSDIELNGTVYERISRISDEDFSKALSGKERMKDLCSALNLPSKERTHVLICMSIMGRENIEIPEYFSDKVKDKARLSVYGGEDEMGHFHVEIPVEERKEIVKEFIDNNDVGPDNEIRSILQIIGKTDIGYNKMSARIVKEELEKRNIRLLYHLDGDKKYKSYKYSKDEVFTKNSPVFLTKMLKRYVELNGILDLNKCYECGLRDEWNGNPIVMHIEHIDGDRYNNSIENLTMLCPNCHSQTDTYCRVKGDK